MSKRHVKAYPKEFRDQVVKLASSSGRQPREIAERFEIPVDSVRRRARRAQLDSGERKDGLTTPERKRASEIADRHPPNADGAPDPSKSHGLVHSGDWFDPVRTIEVVRAYQRTGSTAMMCGVLGVSTSGFHAWRKRPPRRRARENKALSRRSAEIRRQRFTVSGLRNHADCIPRCTTMALPQQAAGL